jgi:hypothetical protein
MNKAVDSSCTKPEMAANPVPPCASLNASPCRQASKLSLFSHTVKLTYSGSSPTYSDTPSSAIRRNRVKKRKPSNSLKRDFRSAHRFSKRNPCPGFTLNRFVAT